MPCVVPFDSKNLDLSFFLLRPTGLSADELIAAMKRFSFHAEDLGCVHSSVLQSIHGNLVIWYGAWIKRSPENREILNDTLLSAMAELSHLAVLHQHAFFDSYAGESVSGQPHAKFSSGDTLFMCGIVPISGAMADLSYAMLALLRSTFTKVGGVSASVCLKAQDKPMVAMLQVWKSLQACYSWLLHSDYRHTVRPYFSHLADDTQFDIFKVVYVSTDEIVNVRYFSPQVIAGSADSMAGEERD